MHDPVGAGPAPHTRKRAASTGCNDNDARSSSSSSTACGPQQAGGALSLSLEAFYDSHFQVSYNVSDAATQQSHRGLQVTSVPASVAGTEAAGQDLPESTAFDVVQHHREHEGGGDVIGRNTICRIRRFRAFGTRIEKDGALIGTVVKKGNGGNYDVTHRGSRYRLARGSFFRRASSYKLVDVATGRVVGKVGHKPEIVTTLITRNPGAGHVPIVLLVACALTLAQ